MRVLLDAGVAADSAVMFQDEVQNMTISIQANRLHLLRMHRAVVPHFILPVKGGI